MDIYKAQYKRDFSVLFHFAEYYFINLRTVVFSLFLINICYTVEITVEMTLYFSK